MQYGLVYSDVLQACRPAQQLPYWGRFAEDLDCWIAPADDDALLVELQNEHSRKDLLRSGVVVRGQNARLEINPIFFGNPNPILAMRATAQGQPFDLLTDLGTARRRLPLYAAVQEHFVTEGVKERGFLLATFSFQDLLALRAVGMPTALALGLEQLTPQSLQQFRSAFGFANPNHLAAASDGLETSSSPSTHESDAAESSSPGTDCQGAPGGHHEISAPDLLILVGWTPSRLSDSRPGASEKVIDNLLSVGSCLGLAIENVLLWMPQVDEIRAIASALDIGTRSDVVNAIVHSLDKSAKPLGSSKEGHEPSLDFVESRRRLQKELVSPDSSSKRRRRKLREFQRTVEAVLVDPLHERAAAEPSLSERSRLAALAEANRTTHLRAAVCSARMEKEISEKGLRAQCNEAEIRDLLKSFEAVQKLVKARR